MKIWDNIMKMKQPYGDDDYESEDGYGSDLYEEDEPIITGHRTDGPRGRDVESGHNGGTPKAESGTFNGKVLNMNNNKPSVVLFRPTCFGDASQAADDLRDKKAVIVNMENVDKVVSRRVVDFLSGCAYALDGQVKKIAQSTYLFCPNSMEVDGELEAVPSDAEGNG